MPGLAGSPSWAQITSSIRPHNPRDSKCAVASAHLRQSEPSSSVFFTIVICISLLHLSYLSYASYLSYRLHLIPHLSPNRDRRHRRAGPALNLERLEHECELGNARRGQS